MSFEYAQFDCMYYSKYHISYCVDIQDRVFFSVNLRLWMWDGNLKHTIYWSKKNIRNYRVKCLAIQQIIIKMLLPDVKTMKNVFFTRCDIAE